MLHLEKGWDDLKRHGLDSMDEDMSCTSRDCTSGAHSTSSSEDPSRAFMLAG